MSLLLSLLFQYTYREYFMLDLRIDAANKEVKAVLSMIYNHLIFNSYASYIVPIIVPI